MTSLTPEQRKLRSQLGAAVSWSRTKDRAARMAPAWRGLEKKLEKQVDPNGEMDPADRAAAVEHARKAYFLALSLKASLARSKAAEARRKAAELDRDAQAADAEYAAVQEQEAASR